jgi:hypothetical protein
MVGSSHWSLLMHSIIPIEENYRVSVHEGFWNLSVPCNCNCVCGGWEVVDHKYTSFVFDVEDDLEVVA